MTPFYRIRWVLRALRDVGLPAHQGSVLYALIAEANRGADLRDSPALPDGFMLDAPEQCRVMVQAGEQFAFGGTLLEYGPREAGRRLEVIRAGLERLSRSPRQARVPFSGEFALAAVEDLVSGHPLEPGAEPRPIPAGHLDAEVQEIARHEVLTLRFRSPLRMERPHATTRSGHRYFDRTSFEAGVFLNKLRKRLPAVGITPRESGRAGQGTGPAPDRGPAALEVLENRLVWLDLAYGHGEERTSLGGAMGRVRLRVADPIDQAALVWGQYARMGKNGRFGFGAYRIEELGPEPFASRRSEGLLELALRPAALDRAAGSAELPSGELGTAARHLIEGVYEPQPPTRFRIRSGDGSFRDLSVPPLVDRTLQRLVLDLLGPGLDQFFETSSLAWRRGLGRDRAPQRIARAYQEGFHHAVRADFDRFFDTIDHVELADRLQAYVADDSLVEVVMRWVRIGQNHPGRGIPIGAPLSPLLGNLFLDQFDEQIESEGGRLVRYADDFMVLCRTRHQAERLHGIALEAADNLRLALNSEPKPVIDLREPFEFLGYRFERRLGGGVEGKGEGWEIADPRPGGPQTLDELSWFDGSRPRTGVHNLLLPGEQEIVGETVRPTAVLGPGLAEITLHEGRLHYRYEAGSLRPLPEQDAPFGTLVVMGKFGLDREAIAHLLDHDVAVVFADESGRARGLLASLAAEDPTALKAQALLEGKPDRVLSIAQRLIAAKLRNHAVLARAAPGRESDDIAERLEADARRVMEVHSLDELRGLEGGGAARWYTGLQRRLGAGFTFEGRVAPGAEDPVNVLLNIAHTALARHLTLAIRRAGLIPWFGIMHRSDGRFEALTADLQEPFRHLMERAVIEATFRLRPHQFRAVGAGKYPLSLEHDAARQFQVLVHRILTIPVVARGQTEPRPYLDQLLLQARSLRRHLCDPQQRFEAFEYA